MTEPRDIGAAAAEMDAEEILAGFERALELERELGVKVVELDRSLLVFPPPEAPVPAAVAAARSDAPAAGAAPMPAPRPAFPSAPSAPTASPPSSGAPTSDLVVVAASPAELQGVAGELLVKMLGAIGRDLGSAPVEVAGPDLAQRVLARNPRIVVMLGRDACRALLPSQRVGKGEWVAFGGAVAAAIPSPAFMLRFYADKPEELNKLKRDAWNTLKLVRERLKQS